MKKLIRFCLAVFVAAPALALEVTNLDEVDHRVRFESAGGAREYEVPVDRTVYISGQPNGRLTLVTAPKPVKGTAPVQSDGLLSKYIGNGRTEGIPAETNDAFVIWKGGEMGIQQRRRNGDRYGR